MTLVMTLLARDEIDIVNTWLAFHLNAGADVVIATDNRSEAGAAEVLEQYARAGTVHLIHRPEALRQDEWVTRMARVAATERRARLGHRLRCRPSFWWPRRASLAERALRRAAALRHRRSGTCASFARHREGVVRRADDRALLGSPPDQQPSLALQADPQDRASWPTQESGSRAATTRWWTAVRPHCAAGFQ